MYTLRWESGEFNGSLDDCILQIRWRIPTAPAILSYMGIEILLDDRYWDLTWKDGCIQACFALIQEAKLDRLAELWKDGPQEDLGDVWLMVAHVTSAIRAKALPPVEESYA